MATMKGKRTILLYTVKVATGPGGPYVGSQPVAANKHVGFGSSEPDSVSREFESRW
jgi:hypothetical protein